MMEITQNQTYSQKELEDFGCKFVHGIGSCHVVWERKIINGSEHKLFSIFRLSGTEKEPLLTCEGSFPGD